MVTEEIEVFKIVKVALISDIHGNYLALEEILKDAKQNGVERYIISGDLVNELPFGNKVIDMIKSLENVYVVKGNREQYLIEYDEEKYTWDNIQFRNNVFMYNELIKENFEYIKNLPFSLSIKIEDLSFKIFHGSIYNISEFIHSYDDEFMEKISNEVEEEILIFGHSHQRIWEKCINGKVFINAGCSGVSKINERHAEYAILNIDKNKYELEKRNIPFDTDKLKEEILKTGILDKEKVFVNLSYLAVTGGGDLTREFFARGKEEMIKRNRPLYKDDAKGIFKDFRLYDDDIWIALTEEYSKYFKL